LEIRKISLFFFACVSLTSNALALKIEPVIKLTALGGQYFFQGTNTSFSGNGDWLLAPGIRFNDKFSLIPTGVGKYRRAREVQELIGGGFLTRETLENQAIVKGIYSLSPRWKTKLKGSFKNQLLVESASETLGNGLYDNNKLGLGLEFERTGTILKSLRLSLDPYAVRFIRYTSLASGSTFGEEIKSGVNTLDFNAYDASSGADLALGRKTQISANALVSFRPYSDQKRVTSSGSYLTEDRKDWYSEVSASLLRALPDIPPAHLQWLAGLNFSYSALISDQHNYDANRTQFNPNYYDYAEIHVVPKLIGRLFGKLDCAMAYDYGLRNYNHRPTQDFTGVYATDKIVLTTHSISYSFKYPCGLGISTVVQGVWRESTSNMAYEATYRYNYIAQHYFAGISWEY
jgi:hypothetical protein